MRQNLQPKDETDEQSTGRIRWDSLEEIAGFHVRMAQAAINRDFTARMKPVGLSQTQYAVLALVRANPGISQIDVARALGSDRATMMALVNRLELRRLIERCPSATDRRKQELRVTEEGHGILARAAKIIARHERATFSGLSAEEILSLADLLKRIYAP